ncbi:MAG: hypothetical protein K2Z81_07375 [Cyanobacteria bacterium]|nr:hypothetical protein [Cyanobacteriota bacterium]
MNPDEIAQVVEETESEIDNDEQEESPLSALDLLREGSQSPSSGTSESAKNSGSGDSSISSALRTAAQRAASVHDGGEACAAEGDIRQLLSSSRPMNVTDQDRARAKERLLSNELMALLPQESQGTLRQMTSALVDGNLDAMKEVLRRLSADPARVRQFVDIVNRTLSRHEGLGGIDLSMDGQGNVLIYEEHGNTAVSINPTSGATTLRAVERQPDGSVLLKPGEIINRQAAEVMRNIGNAATRSIVGPQFKQFDFDPGTLRRMMQNDSSTPQSGALQNLLRNADQSNQSSGGGVIQNLLRNSEGSQSQGGTLQNLLRNGESGQSPNRTNESPRRNSEQRNINPGSR